MDGMERICMWAAELTPLFATLLSFIYGLQRFFKKGKPLFLQSITMAMGTHTLTGIYRVCQMLTTGSVGDGFNPAYLGRIGFFLFFIAASYGQMDRIVDDGSKKIRPVRYFALIAPIFAILLYVPSCFAAISISTKISLSLVWIPAVFSLYYNLKHAIIPDLDFGFIKAIKPYNIIAVCLGFAELLCLVAMSYPGSILPVITSVIFAALCVALMLTAKKGAERWTI